MSMLMVTAAVAGVLWGGAGLKEAHKVADLAFLAGAWESEEEGTFMREVWDAPRGDAMVGHFSIVEGGSAVLYELIAFEQEDDGVVMRLRHFGHGLVPWPSEATGPLTMRLTEVGGGRAVFEDPARDFPRRVFYTLEGDTLTARLVPAEGSEREEIVAAFRRADD